MGRNYPTLTMENMTMDIMNLAKGLLAQKLGGDNAMIEAAMGSLLGGGQQGGGLDIGSLVSGMQAKGLGDVASSWLGDGENADISPDQLKDVLGQDKIAAAAQQLGTDEGSLLDGLKDAIPQMVDKSSSGGNLLDAVGGLGGVANMAKKFL